MIEKIKLWFRRHSLVGYLAPIVVVALALAWCCTPIGCPRLW